MANASNAKIQYEVSQTLYDWYQMTDSGDHQVFSFSHDIVSGKEGKKPVIRPNGIKSGTNLITPCASETDDAVDVAAFKGYFAGEEVTVSAHTDIAVSRGTAGAPYRVNSIVCSALGTVEALAGEGNAGAFATARGTAGGPPSIPLAKIELGQVRTSSETSGVITSSEIYQSVEEGYSEHFDYPLWESPSHLGEGNQTEDASMEKAYLKFYSALPLIHGAAATSPPTDIKPVYAKSYAPVFATLSDTVDWKEPLETGSASSRQIHRKTIAAESTRLGTGRFTAILDNGISDHFVKQAGERLTFKYHHDQDALPYQLVQARFFLDITRPVDRDVEAAVTLISRTKAANFDE